MSQDIREQIDRMKNVNRQLLAEDLGITSSMRIHTSKNLINLNVKEYQQDVHDKPNGFWYSFGYEWINLTKSELYWLEGKYVYEVDVKNANLLQISTPEQLLHFNKQYLGYDGWVKRIDWHIVSRNYDGIEINPHQWEVRDELSWYKSWDVASGCVWDLTKIQLTLLNPELDNENI